MRARMCIVNVASGSALSSHVARDEMLSGNLDFVEFARLPMIRWSYSHWFFADVKPGDYDLVIFQDAFADGVVRLSRMIGKELKPARVNESYHSRWPHDS